MTQDASHRPPRRVVMVTGPSGAGRGTAIKVLEDLGFEAIDNLPLSLVPRLISEPLTRPLAIGLDVRNRDFTVRGVLKTVHRLAGSPDIDAELLYLDCSAEVLNRRFSETRRRHPLTPDESPEFGIKDEHDLLMPIREQATIVIDTSELSPNDLRDALREWYDPEASAQMAISIQSFSYKRGAPQSLDMSFDCRFLRNPHWDAELKPLDGRDPKVQGFVASDPLYPSFFQKISELIEMLLPAFQEEGKTHLVVGFGCTGGQHRSVALAEALTKRLAIEGWQASIRHRELERRASQPVPQVGESE